METKAFTIPDLSLLGQPRVVVVIPAFNEERFIGSVVLKTLAYPVTVIVVDDGSTDLTAELAMRAGAVVIRQEVNRGKGAAISMGMKKALEYQPDALILIDADGQHLPDELPRLLEPVLEGRADMVVGSRYIKKEGKVPFLRVLGHKFLNFLTGAASGVNVSDSQCGYRAFSRRALELINFSSTGFSVESEMQFLAREKNLVIAEVPVTVRYTDKPKRSLIKQGMSVLGGVIRFTGQYRPLFYFGVTGGTVMLVGLGLGVRFVHIFVKSGELALGSGLVCVLLTILGLILMTTGFTLHSVRGLLHEILEKK
jgi:glycosyltransferase involved in cell wall biosynthesis